MSNTKRMDELHKGDEVYLYTPDEHSTGYTRYTVTVATEPTLRSSVTGHMEFVGSTGHTYSAQPNAKFEVPS